MGDKTSSLKSDSSAPRNNVIKNNRKPIQIEKAGVSNVHKRILYYGNLYKKHRKLQRRQGVLTE